MNRKLILILLVKLLQPLAFSRDKVRILFVGTSYCGQIRNTVTSLTKACPERATTEMEFITPGGKTLEFHLGNAATVEKIKTGNWDFVVLQDQSQTPAVFPEKFQQAAFRLDKLIDASGAKTVLYQTWGRKDGDTMNSDSEAKTIIDALTIPVERPKPSAFPADRTLTNADGNQIEMQISGRSKTQIFFTMNRKRHTYDIDQLSEADQKYVGELPINRQATQQG